jgi:8-oxo-dGTP diphosphatase
MSKITPMVGIGIIIKNKHDQILIGKRKNSHAPYYSIPGGHMEIGETFSQCAIREVAEETGLIIKQTKVISVTNNLDTYKQFGKHYISVTLLATVFSGEVKLNEPDKCEGWQWIDPNKVPSPQFDASAQAIQCYLKNQFCIND